MEPTKRIPAPTQLHRSEYALSRYHQMIPEGITLEQVMDGPWWVHTVRQLRVSDIIEAEAMDGSFDVDLRVVSKNDRTGKVEFRIIREAPVNLEKLFQPSVPTPVARQAGRYEVKRTYQGKYRVLDSLNGNIVSDGLSKDAAEAERAALEIDAKVAA